MQITSKTDIQLLHPDVLQRLPFSERHLVALLQQRIREMLRAEGSNPDPAVSIVIRSRNNIEQLKTLFDDIAEQQYEGAVEIIVVDTESSDGSAELARQTGAEVISLKQNEFSYPKALNIGFAAAHNKWVFSLVDHSSLAHNKFLSVATRLNAMPKVAGAYCYPLPNANASRTELWGSAIGHRGWLKKPARIVTKQTMGFLGTNCAVILRDAWEKVGGFDESYGAGGEDSALGRALVKAGYDVMFEPALAVHHSHGLGPINSIHQILNWRKMDQPRDFHTSQLKYRPDLRNR